MGPVNYDFVIVLLAGLASYLAARLVQDWWAHIKKRRLGGRR